MTAETEREPNELTGAIEEAMAALRKLATLYEHSSYDDAKRAHNRLAALLPTLSAASPERVALPEQPSADEWLKEHERLLDEYVSEVRAVEASAAGFDRVGARSHREQADECRAALLAHARLRPAAPRLVRQEPVTVDLSADMHAQLYVLHPDDSISPAQVCAQAGDATNAADGVQVPDGAKHGND